MTIIRESRTHKEINYKTTYRNGGFITYWKLYFQFIPTYHQAVKDFPFLKKTWAWFTFFLKTFWWLFIKPFGAVYKRKRIMKGDFYIINGNVLFQDANIKKTNIHYLLGIPFFANPWVVTGKDWDDILK